MDTPVVFVIFRRPELTARVFERIAAARPKTLLVVADGPRDETDAERCAETRAIIDRVDWPCEVIRNYSDVNLGVAVRGATGITWALSLYERAIIVEDDCLPDPTFFRYAEELLERYATDPRVMMVAGSSFVDPRYVKDSYYFSHYPRIWGWATWRRAWDKYDYEMKDWPQYRGTGWLEDKFQSKAVAEFWAERFDRMLFGKHVGWDFQWQFICFRENGLVATPRTNLITNIGMGVDAAHLNDPNNPFGNHPAIPLDFPLRHPASVTWDKTVDDHLYREVVFRRSGPLKRLIRPVVQMVPKPVRVKIKGKLKDLLAAGHLFPLGE
jgi:hypothetical protein